MVGLGVPVALHCSKAGLPRTLTSDGSGWKANSGKEVPEHGNYYVGTGTGEGSVNHQPENPPVNILRKVHVSYRYRFGGIGIH